MPKARIDVDQTPAIDRRAHQGGERLEPLIERRAVLARLAPGEMSLVDPVDRLLAPEGKAIGDAMDEVRRRGWAEAGGDGGEAIDAGDDDRRAAGLSLRGEGGEIEQAGGIVGAGAAAPARAEMKRRCRRCRGRQGGERRREREGEGEILFAGERQQQHRGRAPGEGGRAQGGAARPRRERDRRQREQQRPKPARHPWRRPGEQGLGGERLDDHAGQHAVAGRAVAVADLDRGRADQDALAAERRGRHPAFDEIDEADARDGVGIDCIVDREEGAGTGAAFGEHRGERRAGHAARLQPEQHLADLAVGVGDDVDCGQEGVVAQRQDRQIVDRAGAFRAFLLAQSGEDDAAIGAGERRRERRIVRRIGGRGEIDVEADGARPGPMQPIDRRGMIAARPGPVRDLADAARIDLDDRDLAAGGVAADAVAQLAQLSLEADAGSGREQQRAAQQSYRRRDHSAPVEQRVDQPERHLSIDPLS